MTDFCVCIKCYPPHVENCPKCFGYGLTPTELTPIPAGEVDNFIKYEWHYSACPVCHGTPKNEHLIKLALEIRHDFILNGDAKEPPIGLL